MEERQPADEIIKGLINQGGQKSAHWCTRTTTAPKSAGLSGSVTSKSVM
jgi:hypothetical protein